MATIIQEGSMSAPNQGGLFQDKIFWLSLRVPQRPYIAEQIKANGGSVVVSEKDAEIRLVDHMKGVDEDGMYSYEYVTKSLKMNRLEDLKSHEVKPKHKQGPGPFFSFKKPKIQLKRNWFTEEEDRILLEVLCQPGVKTEGYAIYQRLADEFPNHTMHSWRGRWVDTLSKRFPSGYVLPKKLESECEHMAREDGDKDQIEIGREGEEFTEEDEAVLEKWADIIAIDPLKIDIYERLNKAYPQHTPKQWQAHFVKVILPKLNSGKFIQKSITNSERPIEESRSRLKGSDNRQPVALNGNDETPETKRKIKFKPEPITSSPDLRFRKQPSSLSKSSPIRTVDVRDRPNITPRSKSKEISKPTFHQQHKITPNSPSYQPTTPTGRTSSTTSSKDSPPAALSTTKAQKSADQLMRWRAEVHRTPTTENPDLDSAPPSSPPKFPSDLLPVTQKRKRDFDATPEQRKKSRNIYRDKGEIPTTPVAESPPSRALSPELLGSDVHYQASSPPPPRDKKKLGYAEMSTQAIYDQSDDDPSLEFPEIEIPGTPPPPRVPSPLPSRPSVQQKPSTPTRILAPASKPIPPSPTKGDPDGIKEMSTFLTYCEEKYKTSEEQVIYAIERASGIKKLVELVLQNVVDAKPLPTHVPGVWSEDEDKVLMGSDSRRMKKLQEEKGARHMEKRMDFLNLWNMS